MLLKSLKEKLQRAGLMEDSFVRSLKEKIDKTQGYAVIRNFPIQGLKRAQIDHLYLLFTSLIGVPSLHTGKNKLVWEVTPNQELGTRTVRTFSELPYEAPMHTDSSFMEMPETYFALLVIQEAETGGNSIVVSVEQVLTELRRLPDSAGLIRTLYEPFPFEVNAAYLSVEEAASSMKKVIMAPILSTAQTGEVEIRYRYDSILSGFAIRPEFDIPNRRKALAALDGVLKPFEKQEGIRLTKGDLIIGHNRRTLHARTSFDDPNRLLLRVRMYPQSQSKLQVKKFYPIYPFSLSLSV